MGRNKPALKENPQKKRKDALTNMKIDETLIRRMADMGLNQQQVAEILGCTDRAIRKAFPSGIFPYRKPSEEVDYELLSRVAGVGCTDSEIAVCMNTSIETHLRRMAESSRYANAVKTGREKVKKELRELRWHLAKGIKDIDGKWIEKPNTAMIFRLSRELLGERDFNGATAVEKREEITHKFDFSKLSMDELKELKSTISKLKEKTNNGSTKVMEVHNNHESLH